MKARPAAAQTRYRADKEPTDVNELATSSWQHRTQALTALAEAGRAPDGPRPSRGVAQLAVALTSAVVHVVVSVSLAIDADRP